MAALVLLAGLIAAPQALAAPNETVLVSRASGPDGAKGNRDSLGPLGGNSISASGRFVAFVSQATNLDPDDRDELADVYVRDLRRNTTTLVSRASGARGAKSNRVSDRPAISADGRFVAFASDATNLHPDATDNRQDVYVRDLRRNTTTLVSRAAGADGAKSNGHAFDLSISADGRFVAFDSWATNLHPDDTDGLPDIFVRDLRRNTTTLASRASGTGGAKSNGSSSAPSISADGRFVAFSDTASNLHPDAAGKDPLALHHVFVRDLEENTTLLASRAPGADGEPSDRDSFDPSISANGRVVAFASDATNLHPGAIDDFLDIFVRDLQRNTTTLASRASGPHGAKATNFSGHPSISADGRLVAFHSDAWNLHPGAFSGVFVRHLKEDVTLLASRASGGAGEPSDRGGGRPSISADGRFVAFGSNAGNLHPDDSDRRADVYRRELSLNRPAKLDINRARISNGRLVVSGSLDPAAASQRVAVRFRAAGRRIVLRPRVRANGRFRADRALRGRQRRVRAGRLVVRFSGNEILRRTSARVRAARRAVRLRITRARVRGNRMTVAGRVAPGARRQVRIGVEFNRPYSDPARINLRARVNDRGRFRLRRGVPAAVRNLGARVWVTHPGRGRLHGQRLGRDVGG